jgi:hypothetical protein
MRVPRPLWTLVNRHPVRVIESSTQKILKNVEDCGICLPGFELAATNPDVTSGIDRGRVSGGIHYHEIARHLVTIQSVLASLPSLSQCQSCQHHEQ